MQPATVAAASSTPHCIALFPGSFKPPHAAHLHAIRHLVKQEHITRIVIIISNRSRQIPGTYKALDAQAARSLLRKMLQFARLSSGKISIQIAEHRAITMALDYFNRVDLPTSLLFCVGQDDFASRDDRFVRIEALSTSTRIPARVEILPRAPIDVHATELRRCIADGGVSKNIFLAALPVEFSNVEKEAIWAESRSLVRPIGSIARSKLQNALGERYNITLDDLRETSARSIDPEFLIKGESEEMLIAKYAGDTTVAGAFDEEMVQKPARRLVVEKRALAHLAKHLDNSVDLPEIVFFSKAQRISVLTQPPGSATTISNMLRRGAYDIGVAVSLAHLLAQIHRCPLPEHPLWGSDAAERNHWTTLLNTLGDRGNDRLKALNRGDLARDLLATVGPAARPCVLHLNFVPENLWQHNGKLGIENFERASCYGDPAYDLATVIAEYVLYGSNPQVMPACLRSVESLATTYMAQQTLSDPAFSLRLATYVGYRLLVVPDQRKILRPSTWHVQRVLDLLERVSVDQSAASAVGVDDTLGPLLTANQLRTAD